MNIGSITGGYFKQECTDNILKILERTEFTLEEILDQEDLTILEINNKNTKLLGFLIPTQLENLIKYIVLDPQDESNLKACYKYPFQVSEIFSSEPSEILDALFDDAKSLELIFSFVDREAVNLTLAGYFSKAVQALLKRNSYELISFLYDGHQYGKKLLCHLYSKSICDLIEKLLSCEDHVNPAYKKNFSVALDTILNGISSLNSNETSVNSASLIENLLSRKQGNPNLREIFSHLSGSAERVKFVFDSLFDGHSLVSRSAAVVIQALLNELIISYDDTEYKAENNELLSHTVINLSRFNEFLLKTPDKFIMTSFKTQIPPIGDTKLKIIEIIITVIKLSNEDLHDSLAASGLLETITVFSI